MDLVKRLHDLLTRRIEDGSITGLVALVARGEEMHVETLGAKTAGSNFPVERDTIFRISSLTKPITAAAAMILVEDCVIHLDDPVDEWLPELAKPRVLKRIDGPVSDVEPARRAITVRDLLTFRVGTGSLFVENPDNYPILKLSDEAELGLGPPHPPAIPEPDEFMRRFGALPLMYHPGERWQYNIGAELLGVLIARASGIPLDAFMTDRLFGPLGMKDTGFHVPKDKLQRFTTCYSEKEIYDNADGEWAEPPKFPSGGAGLVSTVDDYFAFARMLLDNGGPILSRASVELMTTNHVTDEQKRGSVLLEDNVGWGFGMSVVVRRDDFPNVGAYGWDGGLGSSWKNDPSEALIGIILTTNTWTSAGPPSVFRDFWTAAYSSVD